MQRKMMRGDIYWWLPTNENREQITDIGLTKDTKHPSTFGVITTRRPPSVMSQIENQTF